MVKYIKFQLFSSGASLSAHNLKFGLKVIFKQPSKRRKNPSLVIHQIASKKCRFIFSFFFLSRASRTGLFPWSDKAAGSTGLVRWSSSAAAPASKYFRFIVVFNETPHMDFSLQFPRAFFFVHLLYAIILSTHLRTPMD